MSDVTLTPKSKLRKAIAARLKASVTEVGGRVYESHFVPTDPRDWPCIIVHTDSVTVEVGGGSARPGNRPQRREVAVVITVIDDAEPDTTLDDRLDLISLRVEEALMSDPYLEDPSGRSVVEDMRLTETQTDIVHQHGAIRGEQALVWLCTYRTIEGRPSQTMAR